MGRGLRKHRDYVKVKDGVYTTVLHGVTVRVIRSKSGTHPFYHTFSHQPVWKVQVENDTNIVLAEGHTQRNNAVDSAEDAIGRRLKEK